MKLELILMPIWLAVLVPPLVFILAVKWHRKERKQTEKPPQSEKLLRPAGHSLALRLDDTFDALMTNLAAATGFAVFSCASLYLFAGLVGANAPVWWRVAGFLVAALFMTGCVWASLQTFWLFKEAENIRLGQRGEQAVAEALNETADSGFRSFHDLPAEDDWNIDHVAVGTRGVFLIETKARRRRGSRKGQRPHEVVYDGKCLQFPSYRDSKPIEQAKNNAKWLSNFLEKKTGEAVWVEPLVVMPGWFVQNSGKRNFPVKAMNAVYLPGYLRGQGDKIGAAQVRRIITALDEKCRTLEF
jgi:hypothetical protein